MLRRYRVLEASALCLLFACGRDGAAVDGSDSNELIANAAVFDTNHDGTTYRLIAEHFGARGLDLEVNVANFAPQWPLTEANAKTTVLNRFGTPILFAPYGYYHTGLDVMRSDPTGSSDVLAPHDGIAIVFDWNGSKISEVKNPYATVIAIYDPTSHVITQMMHVAALPAIAASAEPFQVQKGQVIGQLAPAPLTGSNAARLSNTQIVFVDGAKKLLLNPAALLAGYKDTVAPQAKELYIGGEDGKVHADFRSGKLDLVVEAADLDDDSGRNLEVSAISFTAKDQAGHVLASQPRCNLDHLYNSIATPGSFRAKSFIDFGSAAAQVSGGWPGSDVDNSSRTFRYALTQLAVENDRCTVLDDAKGFVTVDDSVTKIDVEVTLWDPKGNTSTKTFAVARATGDESEEPVEGEGEEFNFGGI